MQQRTFVVGQFTDWLVLRTISRDAVHRDAIHEIDDADQAIEDRLPLPVQLLRKKSSRRAQAEVASASGRVNSDSTLTIA